jgi:hypothetical protein
LKPSWRKWWSEVTTLFGDLNKHRHRVVNYAYYQAEGISIGSGAIVESMVKQIGRRMKLSGAQWKGVHVPQVLSHRCAYLKGKFSR